MVDWEDIKVSVDKAVSRATRDAQRTPTERTLPDPFEDRSWASNAADVIVRTYPAHKSDLAYKRAWTTVLKLMAQSGIRSICGDMFDHCKYCGQEKVIGQPCQTCGAPG